MTDRITIVEPGSPWESYPTLNDSEDCETYDFMTGEWIQAGIILYRGKPVACPTWYVHFIPPNLTPHEQVVNIVRDFLRSHPGALGFVVRNRDEFGVLRKVQPE